MRLHAFAALFCVLLPGLSSAHEFWIEPIDWQVQPGANLAANLRNGEGFKGAAQIWYNKNIARSELRMADTMIAYHGRTGDRPALVVNGVPSGLAILLHETTPDSLVYKTWEKFAKFVAHKDLGIDKAAHLARGFPEAGFTETYTRHVKALVGVGNADGADQAFGLTTEFVAETNPYAPGFETEMRVRLLYQDAPRVNAQIEIFERTPEGAVNIRLTRTDAEGRAAISVKPRHTYLLDSVVIRDATQEGATYETLWAALTFYVP